MPGRRLIDPLQYSIDVRLDQKATGADPLGGVAKGIQAQQLDTLAGKKLDVLLHQAIGDVCLVVQVDLPLGKGAPDPVGSAVGEGHLAKGLLLLADMNLGQVIRGDLAKSVDVYKELGIRRIKAVLQKILELLGFIGDVIHG